MLPRRGGSRRRHSPAGSAPSKIGEPSASHSEAENLLRCKPSSGRFARGQGSLPSMTLHEPARLRASAPFSPRVLAVRVARARPERGGSVRSARAARALASIQASTGWC